MTRRGRHRGSRVTPKATRPGAYTKNAGAQDTRDEPPLLADIDRALASNEPLDLLTLVSSLVAALDPGREDRVARASARREPRVSVAAFVETVIETDRVEASAMLAVFAQLADDELVRARARRELARRSHGLPPWLEQIGGVSVDKAVQLSHVLGDGDNVMVGVSLPTGHQLSVVVYIDHNLGTVVKDAFVVPGSIDELVSIMIPSIRDADLMVEELAAADARERITAAIAAGAMIYPALETDSWPACRPLVEWVTRLMPEGGTGYVRPDWDERATMALADRFFASPFGADLDDADHRDLLDVLVEFATEDGPGDPLRWSGVSVEILLRSWLPYAIVADADYLALAPDLLRAYVRFCHAERGIAASLTTETLEAVDRYEPEFLADVAAGLGDDPARRLAMQLLGSDALDDLDDEDLEDVLDYGTYVAVVLGWLCDAVGGPTALTTLDDEPLPNRAFSWAGIAPDIRDRVGDVLALCDRFCDERLDVEYRRACRVFLGRVARHDTSVFRRNGRAETAAAAICWTIGKVNELFTTGGMRVMDLTAYFGVAPGGVSQRAQTLIRAAGYERSDAPGVINLADLDLLVSRRRRQIIDLRDRLLDGDFFP